MESLCFLILSAFALYLYIFTRPFKRGFWTRDQSIQYPLLPLTVNMTTVLMISYFTPSLIIMLTEKVIHRRSPLTSGVWRRFSFTTFVNIVLMLFFKFFVGRLRPHFLDVCRPAVDMSSDRFYSESEYECQAHSERAESVARQSFLSGHASLATGAAVFIILYLHHSFPSRSLFKSTVQLIILLIGLYPGITQVNNYWHHWSDVVAGYCAGTVTAVVGYYCI